MLRFRSIVAAAALTAADAYAVVIEREAAETSSSADGPALGATSCGSFSSMHCDGEGAAALRRESALHDALRESKTGAVLRASLRAAALHVAAQRFGAPAAAALSAGTAADALVSELHAYLSGHVHVALNELLGDAATTTTSPLNRGKREEADSPEPDSRGPATMPTPHKPAKLMHAATAAAV